MDLNTENQSQLFPNQQPQPSLPNATAVLVLGIVSIVGACCWGIVGIICAIIAMVLYKKDFKLYNDSPGMYTPASFGNLKTGRICAIIGLCVSIAYLIFIIIYFMILGSAVLSAYPWNSLK
jgi:hypothetical protein